MLSVCAPKARRELSLDAQVTTRTALFYQGGADASLDRPAHVRAGSALVRLGATTLAVVQDDACFIALLENMGDGRALFVRDLTLPALGGVRQFDDGRGNKNAKLDLEACLALDDGKLLVAFGSGSSPARERVVLIDDPGTPAARVTVVHAQELYAAMHAEPLFAGSELNVEGAALEGSDILFFQRGNGAPRGALVPVDATARIDRAGFLAYLFALARGSGGAAPRPCPPLQHVVAWDLGAIEGTRLTFTDAASHGASMAFVACAEASPDATRDGPVSGVAIGRLDDRAREAVMGTITNERGAPLVDKAEGLAFDAEDARRAWLVIDRDDPECPAELLELRLGEGWTT